MKSSTFYTKLSLRSLLILILLCLPAGFQSAKAYHMRGNRAEEGQKTELPSDPYILFEDDFNDGDADGWEVWGVGTWYVDNGEYVVDMGSGQMRQGITWIDHPEWNNYIFEVDVKADLGVDKNVIFRTTKSGDFFGGYWVNLISGIDRFEFGRSYDTLYWVNYSNTTGEWYHLRIELSNSRIKMFVNDQLLITYNDDVYLSGFIGLYGFTDTYGSDIVRYDNVVVRSYRNIYLPLCIK